MDVTSPTENSYTARFRGNFYKDRLAEQLVFFNNTAINSQNPGPDDITSMSLDFDGTSLKGTVFTRNYLLGKVLLNKTAQQNNDGNPVDEVDRQNEILRRDYLQVAGFYYGKVKNQNGGCLEYNACLRIDKLEEQDSRGKNKPYLQGYIYREDFGPGDFIGERNLAISYSKNPYKQIVMSSRKATSQPRSGPYHINLNGLFSADLQIVKGDHLVENLSEAGVFEFKKTAACPARPARGLCLRKPGN
jgi:hypothetical protein